MKAYSMDLRERVVEAVDEGTKTKWEISLLFKVSPAWIRGLLQRRRETGSIAPKERNYQVSLKVDDAFRQKLQELVQETPDATLDELRRRSGTTLSRATVARTLIKMGLTLKKSRCTPASKSGRMFRRDATSFKRP
jgi:transposase